MKKWLVWSAAALVLMVGGPFLAVTLAGWDAMGVCFILFFAANPLFCAVCGAFAGRDMKKLWSLPVVAAALFLAGVWLCFEMGELDFLWYSGIYLAIGLIFMLISALIKRIGKKKSVPN